MLALLWLLDARAEDPAPSPDTGTATPGTATPGATRNNTMEFGLRWRYMSVPQGIVNPFVFLNEGTPFERPVIRGQTFGMEYVIRNKSANGIFYAEYLLSGIKDGYWDDVEKPENHDDGSWLEPQRLGAVMIGADGAYEVYAQPWWSFTFGGGLGLAILTGKIIEWEPGEDETSAEQDNTEPDCGPTEPAYTRKDHCADDGPMQLPPVLPIIDILVGMRFHIADRATIRIEGGFHDMFYVGSSVGVVF